MSINDYQQAILVDMDNFDKIWLPTFDHLVVEKKKVEWMYNKKVQPKYFKERDLGWNLILPIGHTD